MWLLVIIFGMLMGDDGSGVLVWELFFNLVYFSLCIVLEFVGQQLLEVGVDVKVVCLLQVYDIVCQGLLICYIECVVVNGVVVLCGEGSNCWLVVYVDDVVCLYVSVLFQGVVGECYYVVVEEGIVLCDIVVVIVYGLNLLLIYLDELQVDVWFGWFVLFIVFDLCVSLVWICECLQWQLVGFGLLEDLQNMDYYKVILL